MKITPVCSIWLFVILSFGCGLSALAHQPRYITDSRLTVIDKPEISQAFYAQLKGHEDYYIIDLRQEQDLYLQILVPDLPGGGHDKMAEVAYLPDFGRPAEFFAKLDPAEAGWQKFYEEYAGDNYLEGPSVSKSARPGYYVVKVSGRDNEGKYVLVVGRQEEFPADEAVKALITIPQLKVNFFNKPAWSFFEGKIGRYFGLALLIVFVFGFMFYRFNKVCK